MESAESTGSPAAELPHCRTEGEGGREKRCQHPGFAKRHVIDLHPQPIFFLPPDPSFTLCIPIKKGRTAQLAHTNASRSGQRRQSCTNQASDMRRALWPACLVFQFHRGVTCMATNGDAALSVHAFAICSSSFAVSTFTPGH